MDQNQGGQIDEDNLQWVIKALAKSKVVKEYQDIFATMLMLPIPASTDYLEQIKNNHPYIKEELQKNQLENEIDLSFHDSFSYSMSSFDSQSLVEQQQPSQIQDSEQRKGLINIYEHYYPIHFSPKQIQIMVQSIKNVQQSMQKKVVGMQFINLVYQQYLQKGGTFQYQQFWQKLMADILFLLRKDNQKEEFDRKKNIKYQQDDDQDQQNSDSNQSSNSQQNNDEDENDSASSSVSSRSTSSSHSSSSDQQSEQQL